jgi:hypothetical protein
MPSPLSPMPLPMRLELAWSLLCGDWNQVYTLIRSDGQVEVTLRSRVSGKKEVDNG